MTFQEYQKLQVEIVKVLKTKYTNLSVEDAVILTGQIIDRIIITLNLEQK